MSENKKSIHITPQTKVGELLDAYPELEGVFFELSPAFAKLKNPILRKTVARVASLQQAAAVGGLKVDEMVNRLRKECGQDNFSSDEMSSSYLDDKFPAWFDDSNVKIRFDASPIINSGGSPMNEILALTNKLLPDEILELKTPFVPAPIIDTLKKKGFICFCLKKESNFYTYIGCNVCV